jgi:hypothetical protein
MLQETTPLQVNLEVVNGEGVNPEGDNPEVVNPEVVNHGVVNHDINCKFNSSWLNSNQVSIWTFSSR